MLDLRADLITRYRERIGAGVRTKLSQDELQFLIESFLELLKDAKSKEKIQPLCQAELALLEEGYPQATVAKVYLPKYRNAIRAAMADGLLPMTQRTSRFYDYTKRLSGETGVALDHWALDFLKYSQDTYLEIAGKSAERNNAKQDVLKPVNPDVYLAKAAILLLSNDPFELAVGIAAVTGRRFSEVIDKGTLEATDSPYWVRFSGQLKKRGQGERDFLTPCLLPAADVMKALRRFRKLPRIAALAGQSVGELNRSLANSVKRAVHRHFELTGIVPVLEGEAGVTIHNLRGVYGEICVHFFCPPERGVNRFVQERLGHVISEDELKRGNASATQHYFHYYLVDGAGKHLGSKGVLLSEQELAAPAQIDATEQIDLLDPTDPKNPIALVQPAFGAEPEDDGESPSQPPVAEEKEDLTRQVAELKQQMEMLWGQVERLGTSTPLPSPESLPQIQSQVQPEIQSQVQTEDIEALKAELNHAAKERDQHLAELTRVREELASLHTQFVAERLAYQHRIEGLTTLLKSTPATATPTQLTLEGLAAPPPQPINTRKKAPSKATNNVSSKIPDKAPDKGLPVTTVRSPTRSGTRAGKADQRIEAAMRAIMDWNHTHPQHDDKWAITQSILQKSTGSNMPAVRRVMEKFGMEIFEHNASYALNPDRHNFHKDLNQIKPFIQSQL
jgi:integrase